MMKSVAVSVGVILGTLAVGAGEESAIRASVAAYSFRNGTALEAIETTCAVGADAIEFFLWQTFSGSAPDLVLDHRLPSNRISELRSALTAKKLRASNAYFSNAVFRDAASAQSQHSVPVRVRQSAGTGRHHRRTATRSAGYLRTDGEGV